MPVKLCCLSLKRKHCQCEVISYWLQQTKSYKTLPLNSITADRNCANKLYRRCKLPFNKFISLILLGKHLFFFSFLVPLLRHFKDVSKVRGPEWNHTSLTATTSTSLAQWTEKDLECTISSEVWGTKNSSLLFFFSSTYSHNHKKVFSFFQSLIYSGLLPSLCFTTPCLNNQVAEK